MITSFVDLFEKVKARLFQVSAPSIPVRGRAVPAEKSSGERLSKTVLPNVTRTVGLPPDRLKIAAAGSTTRPTMSRTSPAPPSPTGPKVPPAVAVALEPKVERVISLQLSNVLGQIPAGYVKSPDTFDPTQSVSLKASELEKGMASGQPSVPLSSIYEQVPEIFLQSLSPTDSTRIPLPFEKVLDLFNTAHVRADQEHDQAVPQVETPILTVAIEDTERFGSSIQPLQASAEPPVKVEPATAKTIAAAEPEPSVRETVAPAPPKRKGIPLTPSVPKKSKAARPSLPLADIPARIPFHLPPNGTGVPASERVPASSGPPVPTTPKEPQIPFKVPPPCNDLRPKLAFVPGVEGPDAPGKDPAKIALSLHALMENVPAFQLNGSPSTIPENVRVEFPLSLIEPQLVTGRVAVPPKIFQAAMPQAYRDLFIVDPSETPVLLLLPEVLNNMPADALRIRQDQEEVAAGESFQTPFSIKAEEDAKRFNVSGAPIAKRKEKRAVPEEITSTGADLSDAAGKIETEEIDAKQILVQASSLPGVAACAITFADGLSLAGNFPAEVRADGLCAMAPSLIQRIDKHMLDTKLGSLTAITLHCEKSRVTFFMQGNICLAALHSAGELPLETGNTLAEMAKKLSRTYAQPEAAHVDH